MFIILLIRRTYIDKIWPVSKFKKLSLQNHGNRSWRVFFTIQEYPSFLQHRNPLENSRRWKKLFILFRSLVSAETGKFVARLCIYGLDSPPKNPRSSTIHFSSSRSTEPFSFLCWKCRGTMFDAIRFAQLTVRLISDDYFYCWSGRRSFRMQMFRFKEEFFWLKFLNFNKCQYTILYGLSYKLLR